MSWPDDAPRWLALATALVVALALTPLLRRSAGRRALITVCPALAAIGSAIYVLVYLRGGPRIIDATAYWLQAKALSQGMLSIPLPEGVPEQAIAGRFLLLHGGPHDAAVSVIFPPGYPALLALGFAAGAPLAVGPALAALLVLATMELTRGLARRLAIAEADTLVAVAALSSALCAALRYHTADTMSHGAAALWLTTALAAALAPSSRSQSALVGLALGMLFCTRPASALAVGAALGLWWWTDRRPLGTLPWALCGAMPPLALWLAHQHAATGSFFATAQGAYYAISDGPPGCFRYGFGAGIGCLGEHGDFVRHNLPDGYGAWAALKTTGRRLMLHAADAMGLWPLSALWLVGAFRRRIWPIAAVIPLLVLAYAPFYFDGNYPGGGARMFIDAVPLEHALAAIGLHALAATRVPRTAALAAALGLMGFAFHLGERHRQLRDREHGRPMFDEGIGAGLVFVDTDHGFNLALAWSLGAPGRHAARYKGDALDAITLRAFGVASGRRYLFPEGRVVAYAPLLDPVLDIEGASLWPPRQVAGGWTWPAYVPLGCVSGGRVLALYPTAAEASTTLALPQPGTASLWLANLDTRDVDVTIENNSTTYRVPAHGCAPLPPVALADPALRLRATGAVGLDRLELR